MAESVTLTRRFGDAAEVRSELHANVLAGSLWIPRPEGSEPLEPRQHVEVMLVLPDGRVLDGIKGRVFCLAPGGVAVFVEDMPAAALAVLSEEPEAPKTPVSGFLDPVPDPTSDPPRDTVLSGDDPFAAAFPTAPSPQEAPAFEGEPLPAVKSPDAIDPDRIPPHPAGNDWFSPPAEGESPIPYVKSESDDRPVVKVGVTPQPASFLQAWEDTTPLPRAVEATTSHAPPEIEAPPAELPILSRPSTPPPPDIASPDEPVPELADAGRVLVPPPPVFSTSAEPLDIAPKQEGKPDAGAKADALAAELAAARGEVDFPAMREAEPLPALKTSQAMWEVGDDELPAPKAESAEAEPGPASTPAPPAGVPATGQPIALVMPFATLADFKKEYEANIRRGGVLVPSTERPAIRSQVDVVFSLMQGKREIRLRAECVFHAPTGVGVQISTIPVTTRREIEALLAAATPVPEGEPAKSAPIIPPPPGETPRSAPPLTPSAPAFASARGGRPVTNVMAAPPAGKRIEGDLVEVLREAEVEGETRTDADLGPKGSWLRVLASLSQEAATGILFATRKGETKTFLVHQGRVFDASGQPMRDDESIVRVVRKHALLKGPALHALERAVLAHPADDLAAANASGSFQPQELERTRRWQILERCAEVFAWEKGRFRFEPDGDRKWARPTSGVPIGHVILHGVRSYIRASGEDLARVLRHAIDRVAKLVPESGFDPTKVGMTDKELRFLADVDGTRSIRQLLAITPLPVSHTYRLIFALCRLGVMTLEKAAARVAVKEDHAKTLEARLAEMKGRDPFVILSLSWMAALPQVQAGWNAFRKELEADLASATPGVAAAAKQVLAKGEEAYKALSNDRNRRLTRLKVIEDPARIESAADMLAEKAALLLMRGEKADAIAAMQMALDMAPERPEIQAAAGRILRGDGQVAAR